ncbi:MAG: hypothetical protein OCD02_18240 [Spirochaetaceae bacterium]
MKKIYFTALIPASNLDNKYKKIQLGSPLLVCLPPIAILESYSSLISKNEFNKKIDILTEFRTGDIKKIDDWWGVSLPNVPLNAIFNGHNLKEFPSNEFFILLGRDNKGWNPPEITYDVIRNWDLGFYELTMWDLDNPLDNIELVEYWRIKKKRLKTERTKVERL